MSGLTKRIIYADRHLSAILGVTEGSLVSYADISKGIHAYIKKNGLKNPESVTRSPEIALSEEIRPQISEPQTPAALSSQIRECRDCGERIPVDAFYCDMCGMQQ
jgi:hypothetical protein